MNNFEFQSQFFKCIYQKFNMKYYQYKQQPSSNELLRYK
jgi:hypothetical protein